uniref:Ig-like domain-containing protein n=1 Tax=Cyclopterus lumpus TaxID=8103 RepID=A0A8C2WGX2_CYCLU
CWKQRASLNAMQMVSTLLLSISPGPEMDTPSVRLSALPSRSGNTPLTLYCDVESFYPEEVSVSWLQNSTVLPEPPATEQNPDGTYRTRHYYTLSPEQREQGGKVECAVNQPGVVHPVSGSAYLNKLDPQGICLTRQYFLRADTGYNSHSF